MIQEKIIIALNQAITKTPEQQARYFKTGPSGYAAHDQFLGIAVPDLRKIARIYEDLPLDDLKTLLAGRYNEERLLALIILTRQFKKATSSQQTEIYEFYLSHLSQVNNWNLVDSSAHLIVGAYLLDKDKTPLLDLVSSAIMWERRIAIVSTWWFIRHYQLDWTFKLASLLLQDTHDLMHKATGWMLREAGKKDSDKLIEFLDQFAPNMPRTMLRYALEKFQEPIKKKYF